MFFRSRSRSLLALGAAVLLVASVGCSKSKPKPQISIPRSGLTADGAAFGANGTSYGTPNWSPNGSAPGTNGFGDGTDVSLAGSGSEFDPNALNYDETGSLTNNIAGAGVADGAFTADLDMIHFQYDSSEIPTEWTPVLDQHADWIKSNQGLMVQVEGHCDERGTEEYNVTLGQRRADSVREYMVTKGIDANRLSTISYGKLRPLTFDQSDDAHSLNRRAMFLVFSPGTETASAY